MNRLLFEHSAGRSALERAIKLTEKYVTEHKLLLVGGMAIDLALRAKGQSIYEEGELPDIDIFNERNVHHAQALAKLLFDNGISGINVINAIHITTVKVRLKREVLLDATFVPSGCMERIPWLDIGDWRVAHPHYQFVNQRASMSTLLHDNGVTLNIFHRLTKYMNRNCLLRSYYPLTPRIPEEQQQTRTVTIPLDIMAIEEDKLREVESSV